MLTEKLLSATPSLTCRCHITNAGCIDYEIKQVAPKGIPIPVPLGRAVKLCF